MINLINVVTILVTLTLSSELWSIKREKKVPKKVTGLKSVCVSVTDIVPNTEKHRKRVAIELFIIYYERSATQQNTRI